MSLQCPSSVLASDFDTQSGQIFEVSEEEGSVSSNDQAGFSDEDEFEYIQDIDPETGEFALVDPNTGEVILTTPYPDDFIAYDEDEID